MLMGGRGESLDLLLAALSNAHPLLLSAASPAFQVTPVKICDLNLGSKPTVDETDRLLYTPVGTPEFMARELAEAITQGDPVQYDKRCDIWSLGVIVYIILSGERPFVGTSSLDGDTNPQQAEFNTVCRGGDGGEGMGAELNVLPFFS